MSSFEIRGVIEGFYGTPWAHGDRLWLLGQMGAWGMNRYVYAPKDDPFHLARWREPYPGSVLRELHELVRVGADVGVEVGFSVSPGRSITYGDAADREALVAKLDGFAELGARHLTLAVDDVPSQLEHEADRIRFGDLASAQVDLMDALVDRFDGITLAIVPTDYLGVEPTPYLERLGESLPEAIEIGWTGRTVCSPAIEAAEAAARAKTLRRRLVVWDNVPVNDGPMRGMLHMAPYVGRAPTLPESCRGILLNPMNQCRASAVTLETAAAYLRDPEGYEAEAAWAQATGRVGAGSPAAFKLFAAAHRYSPSTPDDRDAGLEALVDALRRALGEDGQGRGREVVSALEALEHALQLRIAAPDRIREELLDARLLLEIEPWLANFERETARMHAAVRQLQRLHDDEATASDRALGLLGMEAGFTRLPPRPNVESFGPRRVLYPQLVSMEDDAMAFGVDPALHVDRCLADEVVALAEERSLAMSTRR